MLLRLRTRLQLLALLCCGVLGTSGVAFAQPSEADKAYWQDRYRTVIADFDSAKSAHEAAELRYQEAARANRRRSGGNRTRGAEREAVRDAVPETAARLAEATQALEEFPETARRAGVPPGWLREVDEARADAALDAERAKAIEARSPSAGADMETEAPADTP